MFPLSLLTGILICFWNIFDSAISGAEKYQWSEICRSAGLSNLVDAIGDLENEWRNKG